MPADLRPAATILIVDDEAQNRKLLEALLWPEGYLTLSAANGEEALALIAQRAPDLILLDIMMPGMNGYQVAGILKADPATSNIPIIMVTAHTERGARLAGLDAGAEDFLTKPVDRAELWLRVRNLLRLKTFGDFLRNQSLLLEQQLQQLQLRTAGLQRFRAAMDTTADAIMLVSRSSMRFIEVNMQASVMLGYTREELFQLGPAQLGAGTPEQMERMYDAIISGDRSYEVSETQLRRKDGSELQVEAHRHAQRSGGDWIIVAIVHDISERKEAEKRLHYMAHYDALTGLPNRRLFYETLKKTLAHAAERSWLVAVLFVDLDHFKDVNDTLGHTIGDALLIEVSNRLVDCVRIRDTVGRLSGDEFALILVMQEGQQGAAVVAQKIRDALRRPLKLQGHEVSVTTSIGITIYPDDASEPGVLIQYADTAMYQAKQAGRDTFRFFTAQMNAEAQARLELETALRKAVENNEFVLHYQPKVQLNSGRIAGLEALLRWQRPGHGLVPPNDFIPVLEETGLIVRVGSWVIAEACRQIGLWLRTGIGPVPISVNVSGRQFIEGDLEADIVKALDDNRITAELLELELTESSLMENTELTIASLQSLKKRGLDISIDDFGTGYSNLAYLCRFPIDKLKIDIAFVREITSKPDDAAIALAIIQMARSLKLEVVAEGVETAAQLAYLRRHHCDQIQGYYFSRPLPAADIEQMLREEKCLPIPDGEAQPPFKTLMLVDDDPGVMAELKLLLRPDGYHILSASSAAEGFELLALHPVQVLLCDQRMPAMIGTIFLDRVKNLYPDTLRILLSGYSDMQVIMEAINLGAVNRFYTKPWDDKVLRANLREAFRQHALVHAPQIARADAVHAA
ncbi:MAG: diguanylate cyclase [Hydrocarboniphaga sp.]|uniref:EAL domain-containing protein n=1 Tax=Hydrocarboniphaga sp. TaxID=2033016 RepID=UPI0026385075|nr:EAL domain-containing protein [Hydrocarboniphaga sp.]MDB5968470.1 diguanylate cyclase [Hydrocarboniphaga sp.]